MIDAERYTISIRKVIDGDDVYFEARVKELPDIYVMGKKASEAYKAALDTITDVCSVFERDGREFPRPY